VVAAVDIEDVVKIINGTVNLKREKNDVILDMAMYLNDLLNSMCKGF